MFRRLILRNQLRKDRKTEAILLAYRQSAIAHRKDEKEDGRQRELAWRAAGRPVWRESADRLTAEHLYLDVEDMAKAMGTE